MMNLWKKLNENPVYIREKLLFSKEKARKKFVSAFFIHLAILILPALSGYLYGIFDKGLPVDNLKILFSFSMVFSILFYLVVGFSSCSLFARERERRTYDDLISTAMSPEEIVLGKFWSSFYPAALEMTTYFPIYLIMGLLLKMSLLPLFLIYVFVLVVIALTSLTGLYFSINAQTADEAGVKCGSILYPIFFVVSGFTILGPIFFIMGRIQLSIFQTLVIQTLLEILCIINPATILLDLFSWAASGSMERVAGLMFGLNNTPLIFPAAMLIYILAAMSLYKKVVSIVAEIPGAGSIPPVEEKSEEAGTPVKTSQEGDVKAEAEAPQKPVSFIQVLLTFPEIILFPRQVAAMYENPVLLKDNIINNRRYYALAPVRKKRGWKDLLLAYSASIPIFLYGIFLLSQTKETAHYLFVLIFSWILINFSVSSLSSGDSIKREKIAGTWDNLVSSLLTPEDIFWGKFWFSFFYRAQRIYRWFPVFLIAGVLCKVTIPGVILFFILTFTLGASFTVSGLYDALKEGRKIPLKQKISDVVSFPLAIGSVLGSALLVEKVCRSFNLIPLPKRESFLHIYPIPDLFFNLSKGVFDGFSPLQLLSGLAFITIFLAILIPMTKYFYRKSLEILREV